MAYDQMTADLQRENSELKERLSAAEKERDEALAYADRLQSRLHDIATSHDLSRAMCSVYAQEALSTPAPAALAHLRQEIRMEALEEAAKHFDSSDTFIYRSEAAAAIRRLAEEAKEQEGKG